MISALVISVLLGVTDMSLNLDDSKKVPNIDEWTVVSRTEIDFYADDYRRVYLGEITEYQNPSDANEFVRVYTRHIAIVADRPEDRDENKIRDTQVATRHHEHRVHEALAKARSASDTFAYVRIRTSIDTQTEEMISSGQQESWLLDHEGNYVYGERIVMEPISESLSDRRTAILVGIKFSLGTHAHILFIDPYVMAKEGGVQ